MIIMAKSKFKRANQKSVIDPDNIIGLKKTRHFNTKKVLIGVGLIVALILIGLVINSYIKEQNKSPYDATGRDTRKDIVKEAFDLAEQNKNKAAKAKINEVFRKVKSEEDKTLFLGNKISLCLTIKDFECALETNKERSKIAGNEIAGLISEASIYSAQNKKAEAIKVYEAALLQIQKTQNEDKQVYIDEINARLESLRQ